ALSSIAAGERHMAPSPQPGDTPTRSMLASRASGAHPRLRLGYVSSDFGTHPIAFLLAELWERHDRSRFETYAYSIAPPEDSPLRRRIEASFDHFADCAQRGIEETAECIRADGIDILIELNGYTTNARSELLALR